MLDVNKILPKDPDELRQFTAATSTGLGDERDRGRQDDSEAAPS